VVREVADEVTGVEWSTPGPPRNSYDWREIGTMLREHPGQWLKLADRAPRSLANALRAGIGPIQREQHYEITTRNNATTEQGLTCTIFLRFNPPEADDAP